MPNQLVLHPDQVIHFLNLSCCDLVPININSVLSGFNLSLLAIIQIENTREYLSSHLILTLIEVYIEKFHRGDCYQIRMEFDAGCLQCKMLNAILRAMAS